MNATELKRKVLEHKPTSFFFSRDSMKCWGDTMKNYGVRKAVINTREENDVPVWELYRKRPVGVPPCVTQQSAYFRQDNFVNIFPKSIA